MLGKYSKFMNSKCLKEKDQSSEIQPESTIRIESRGIRTWVRLLGFFVLTPLGVLEKDYEDRKKAH